jgi:hypothetical protein
LAILCLLFVATAPAHASPATLTLSESVSFISNAPNNLSVVLPDEFDLIYTVVATSSDSVPVSLSIAHLSNETDSGDAADLAILGGTNDQCAGPITLTPITPFNPNNPLPSATCTVTQTWLTPAPAFNGSSVVEQFSLQVRGGGQSASNGMTVFISDPVQSITPTPEPASIFLFGSGLLAIGLLCVIC